MDLGVVAEHESKVWSFPNIAVRYAFIVRLYLSALAFVCGWYGDVLSWFAPNHLVRSCMTALRNSLPLSLTIAVGTPNLQIHRSKNALATVDASLLWSGTSSVYLVKASVITRITFFPDADLVLRGPNKSMLSLIHI